MIDELYKEGRDYEYFTRMREAEMQNEAYRQSEQEAKEIIAELKQENEKLKKQQRPLEVNKKLYDAYCETHCRANDIAIDIHKEFDFISEEKIIPIIKEGIRILRFQRDNYRKALEEIREKAQHCIKQDVCALCDYSEACAVPDSDGLVYDNNRLLIKLINEVLG